MCFSSFADGDKLTIQFRTSSRNGLIFHAQSRHLKHELTAYIEEGQIRLRLSGHCHWLYVRDIAHDSYNVSDNNFHTVSMSDNLFQPKQPNQLYTSISIYFVRLSLSFLIF